MPVAPSRYAALLLLASAAAALLLWAVSGFDYGVSGTLGQDSDHPFPPPTRMSYSLLGYSYWHGAERLTGPHRPLAWALAWLLALTLAWGWQLRRRGRGYRRGFQVSLAALLFSLGSAGLILLSAERAHTRFLGRHDVSASVSASLTALGAEGCARRSLTGSCPAWDRSTFPNPFAVSVAAILAGAALAALTSRRP